MLARAALSFSCIILEFRSASVVSSVRPTFWCGKLVEKVGQWPVGRAEERRKGGREGLEAKANSSVSPSVH